MPIILKHLERLSAPCLTHISIHLRDEDFDIINPSWDVDIFCGSAPLLHTVRFRGITLANCYFPPAAIVELEIDARNIPFGVFHPKVFKHMPNLKIADVRGSLLEIGIDDYEDQPAFIPNLERLTWGCLTTGILFQSIVTPALRYLCLTSSQAGVQIEAGLQDFPQAIADCPRIPILPNLEELCYDIKTNYAADCIFVGLPRVSTIHFPEFDREADWQPCDNFFKALVQDSSRWPRLRTIIFKRLPPELFNSFQIFILARSSEEHRFTICIERDHPPYYPFPINISAEHLLWLEQHANVERT
jgi:hypothetical protein